MESRCGGQWGTSDGCSSPLLRRCNYMKLCLSSPFLSLLPGNGGRRRDTNGVGCSDRWRRNTEGEGKTRIVSSCFAEFLSRFGFETWVEQAVGQSAKITPAGSMTAEVGIILFLEKIKEEN